jgi:hypothetical protein
MEIGHVEWSRLGQHSFEENCHVLWDEAKVIRDKRIQCMGSLMKWPTWHVHKTMLADPASKFLPSRTLWLANNYCSNVFWSLEDSQLLRRWC